MLAKNFLGCQMLPCDVELFIDRTELYKIYYLYFYKNVHNRTCNSRTQFLNCSRKGTSYLLNVMFEGSFTNVFQFVQYATIANCICLDKFRVIIRFFTIRKSDRSDRSD